MTFRIKELFHTLQGEGMRAGRSAVFCRFSGCNLWSGRPEDRAAARCTFCDTDFVGADAGEFGTVESLADAILATFPPLAADAYGTRKPLCRVHGRGTGPSAHGRACRYAPTPGGLELGVETNGTLLLPPGLDWITVSPKAGNRLVTVAGDELKLVWPQQGCRPEDFETLDFRHFILQPCDDARNRANTRECVEYCLTHPRWSLGLQTHKWIGVR